MATHLSHISARNVYQHSPRSSKEGSPKTVKMQARVDVLICFKTIVETGIVNERVGMLRRCGLRSIRSLSCKGETEVSFQISRLNKEINQSLTTLVDEIFTNIVGTLHCLGISHWIQEYRNTRSLSLFTSSVTPTHTHITHSDVLSLICASVMISAFLHHNTKHFPPEVICLPSPRSYLQPQLP